MNTKKTQKTEWNEGGYALLKEITGVGDAFLLRSTDYYDRGTSGKRTALRWAGLAACLALALTAFLLVQTKTQIGKQGQPGDTEPGVIPKETSEPGQTEPAQPESAQPESAQPEPAQPEPAQPESGWDIPDYRSESTLHAERFLEILKRDGFFVNGQNDKTYNADGIVRVRNITPESVSSKNADVELFFVEEGYHCFLMTGGKLYRCDAVGGFLRRVDLWDSNGDGTDDLLLFQDTFGSGIAYAGIRAFDLKTGMMTRLIAVDMLEEPAIGMKVRDGRAYLDGEELRAVGTDFQCGEFLPASVNGLKLPDAADLPGLKTAWSECHPEAPLQFLSDGRFAPPVYYYGRFGDGTGKDCAVLFLPTGQDVRTTLTVGGFRFTCEHSFVMEVYRDGTLMSVQEAYDAGYLDRADLRTLKKRHDLAMDGKIDTTDYPPDSPLC